MAVRIAAAVDGREGPVELRLDPPELGKVRVSLAAGESGAQVLVVAERPETAELLRRHADLLAREMAAAGHARVDVDVSTGGRDGFERQAAGSMAGESQGDGDAPAPERPSRAATATGLDLRL